MPFKHDPAAHRAGTPAAPTRAAGNGNGSQPGHPGKPAAPAHPAEVRIRVLVVDDHPVVRRGIRSCLAQAGQIEVVGEASDGVEALALAKTCRPDVVLADINMPHMNGLALTDALRRELPSARVLILSMHTNTDYVLRILRSGAKGYVLKDADAAELVLAVKAAHKGDAFFSPSVARVALNEFVHGVGGVKGPAELTQRERDVLVGIAEGLSNKEIADRLGVGVRTVESHREHLMDKLGVHNVAGLTKIAIAKGWVSVESNRDDASPPPEPTQS
jgi:two-component system, NarL family, nitrate/nitrite response regulator NarL